MPRSVGVPFWMSYTRRSQKSATTSVPPAEAIFGASTRGLVGTGSGMDADRSTPTAPPELSAGQP